MSRKAEVIERTTVYDGYFPLDEVKFRHTRFDGSMSAPVGRIVLNVGEVVAGLILKPEDRKVVLIEQFRLPATMNDDGWLIEIVAGRVDAGETTEEAFRRETREEAGYEISNLRPVHRFYPAAGTMAEHMTLYVAEAAKKVSPGGGTDEDEDIRVIEWDYDTFFAALDAGKIVDAKTLVAGLWLWRTEHSR